LEYNGTVHQLFIDSEKVHDSVRREVLHNILSECGIPMKLAKLSKMCLKWTCSKFRTDKTPSDAFLIQNGEKLGDVPSPLLFKFALEYAIRKVLEMGKDWTLMEHITS